MWQYSERLTGVDEEPSNISYEGGTRGLYSGAGESVEQRKDELGRIGKSAVQMQCALRELVEQDSLTGLYNRHYGEIWSQR